MSLMLMTPASSPDVRVDDEERLLIGATRAPQIGAILARRRRRDDVAAMQGSAAQRRLQVVALAARARTLEADARLRLRRATPS